MAAPQRHLPCVTNSALLLRPAATVCDDERLRCDVCGRLVIDLDAHLVACIDHEAPLLCRAS